MIVLVPAHTLADLVPLAADAAPDARLIPYEEDGDAPAGSADADAVFRWVAGKRYEGLVLGAPGVRWLHTASAGVDHVLTPVLRERGGFILTDSGPAFAAAIGEYVVAWMLHLAHKLDEVRALQPRREWRWVTDQEELGGQTVGIVGLGPVGLGIAARCQALGMRVLGHRRGEVPTPPGVDRVFTGRDGLRTLLAESDWVILAAALTNETRGLVGAAEIAAMKPTARLLNVARGPMLDTAALLDALRAGRLAGAVLDVFDQEPLPPDSPLWDTPNLYVSPHTSPWTRDLRGRQIALFVENLRRFAAGEPLAGVVDLARGY